MAAVGKSLAALFPKVVLPAGGAGVVGESCTPLKTGMFVNGPGGAPAVDGAAPIASQTLGSLPNGGCARLVRTVEAVKTPATLCVLSVGSRKVKAGPGLVLGMVLSGGSSSSGLVIPIVVAQGPSLVEAEKRMASLTNSWSIS